MITRATISGILEAGVEPGTSGEPVGLRNELPPAEASPAQRAIDGRNGDARPAEPAALHVYNEVKNRILNNQLHPGNKLTYQGLADRLAVSRTPVREALERLCQEGFAIHVPRRGYFVAEIDEKEARELFEVREALEVFALRQTAAAGVGLIDFTGLRAINEDYRRAVRDGGTKVRMLIDRRFHLALAASAANDYLNRSLDSIFERVILKLRVDGYSADRGLAAWLEHQALLEALAQGAFGEAETLLSCHVRAAHERLVEQVRRSRVVQFTPLRC